MKKVTYILIPGLWDQKALFGWFYTLIEKWWRWNGMHTIVCQMKWVSAESLDKKLQRLERSVEMERKRGREVVLVGVSAGGPVTIIGLAKYDVLAAVSISGFLRLTEEDRENVIMRKLSWFEAADRAEKVSRQLSRQQRHHILSLSGIKDDLIDPQREHIKGARQRRIQGSTHLSTVVKILIWYPYSIKRFVRKLHR